MMRSARFIWVLAAAAALLALPAKAPAAEGLPHLKGVNVIEGDFTGYVPVRLSKPTRIDSAFYPNESVTVEGEGKLHAIVLRQVGSKPSEEPVLVAGRFNPDIFCTGCATRIDQGISVIGGGAIQGVDSENKWPVPAGDYRLYFVTDGPGRVTLRLPGLDGTAQFAPAVPTAAKPKVLPLLTPVDARNQRTHGASGQLDTGGIVFETHLFYYGLHAHSDLWTCWYVGEPTHPLSFYPTCPTESDQDGVAYWMPDGIVQLGASATAGVGMLRPERPGTYSAGGTMTSVSTTSSSGWAAAWINFEPTAAGSTPQSPATTPAPGPGTSPGPAQEPRPPATGARTRIAAKRVVVRGRRATVRLQCEGGADCRGTLSIANGRRHSYQVQAGRTKQVRVVLPAALARSARSRRGAATTLSLAQGAAVHTVRVTLRAKRR
jgi:hypothetical protein